MLSFDIRALDTKAAQVDGLLAPDDPVWQEGDPLPSVPVHATGRLSTAGSGKYFWSGAIEGTLVMPCRRCLADVTATVSEDVHLVFADADEDEADDPDVYPVDPRAAMLDLRPAVREQWLLNAPAYVLCREDCQGLCPNCGTDLNTGRCDCPPASDARWDALRAVRTDSK
jgi:uncharacterized protein